MMTRRTVLEAAFGIHKVGNSWSALIQSLLGVKHSAVIIHIKYSAEAAFLALAATQTEMRVSEPKVSASAGGTNRDQDPLFWAILTSLLLTKFVYLPHFFTNLGRSAPCFISHLWKEKEVKDEEERTATTHSVLGEERLTISFWSLPAYNRSAPLWWLHSTVPNLPFYIPCVS